MHSFEAVLPRKIPTTVLERFFIAKGNLPPGMVLEDKPMPSIMQSLIIDFGGTPQTAILPNGKLFNCEGDLIMGQFSKRYSSTISGTINAIGIQMAPTGIYRLFRQPMTQFANSISYLKDYAVWHASLRRDLEKVDTNEDRISILEHYLQENLWMEATDSLTAIEEAARLIRNEHATITLPRICKSIGMSDRSLQRYFTAYIGVNPKAFMRIARINAVTKLIEQDKPMSWQDILNETGYFDPAHFTKDFKSITGKTPSDYYKGKTDYEKFFYGT
ncbi:helix-turn-helix domain-containing protein [Flavihumibacter rivuli]|uniref:helix-turn-helix domain-containing protein n=1 Tax=Flavihumibacter rivuli TaxID=2838156 RepID=UPI001BDE923A|nr:helix-turn-helix domain-containing protein [Flavihumibacter rivuli]ULQ55489.1 helix-turn-helix domain-containing protein [Flavihumibacter rivuli]